MDLRSLSSRTRSDIALAFERLDYSALADIYCDEGGAEFWKERRGEAQELGSAFALVLGARLPPKGRSLYVGAGVAEIPMLSMETLELDREVVATNLRTEEVVVLNQACRHLPFTFQAEDARTMSGEFDHLWIVSVLNDPECFPQLGALSSGWANPVTFNVEGFVHERSAVLALAARCFEKIVLPGLITTSIEEIVWVTDWCARHNVSCTVEEKNYPTAIVGDPVTLVRLNGAVVS